VFKAAGRPLIAIGGMDSETSFEQAVGSLAHSYFRGKAPGLLGYQVGFQLLERNEDNTRAVGVFGFKVGPSCLYAPVFFLNGNLEGHELLFLKNQDMFVPLTEGWRDYLLPQNPPELGTKVSRGSRELGVLPPDIQQLKRNPYKFASENAPASGRIGCYSESRSKRRSLPIGSVRACCPECAQASSRGQRARSAGC
jgi:hypothetical protein